MNAFLLRRLSFKTKLLISYLLIGFIPLGLLSFILFKVFENSIIDRTKLHLVSVNTLKKRNIEDFFKQIVLTVQDDQSFISDHIHYFPSHYSDSVMLINSNKVKDEWQLLKLFSDYIIIKKENDSLRVIKNSKSPYDQMYKHEEVTPYIYINSTSGIQFLDISSFNVLKKTQLICVVKKVIEEQEYCYVYFINQDKLHEIVEVRSGMGETGESYIVSETFEMKSRSRFLDSEHLFVKTPSVIYALEGHKGSILTTDYRGVEVVSVYNKLSVPGLSWVIISEIDLEEAMSPAYVLEKYMLLVILLTAFLLVLITLYLSRIISDPINSLNHAVRNLSKGKLNFTIDRDISNDELGRIQESIIHLRNNLFSTTHFASEIGNGNFTAIHQPLSEEDTLGYTLLRMRDKLIQSKELEAQLVRQKSSALIEGQEKERERISRELHDSLGQMLTAIRLRVGLIKENHQVVKDLKNIIDDTIAEIRRISNNAMPSVLIDFGLESGLKLLCENSSRISEDIIIQFSYNIQSVEEKELPYDVRISLYRIAQEAINNAIKYSTATQITVKVNHSDKTIQMTISDNGKGFNTDIDSTGMGLFNMRERAKLAGGICTIKSKETGTVIQVNIPL